MPFASASGGERLVVLPANVVVEPQAIRAAVDRADLGPGEAALAAGTTDDLSREGRGRAAGPPHPGRASRERTHAGLALAVLTPEALELVRQAAEERAAALVTMTLLALAQQALSVLEVYLILRWLGTDPSPASAIMFEGAIKIVNAAGTVVPGRLGIYEGASGVLADALRLGAAAGPARRWRGARGRSSGP